MSITAPKTQTTFFFTKYIFFQADSFKTILPLKGPIHGYSLFSTMNLQEVGGRRGHYIESSSFLFVSLFSKQNKGSHSHLPLPLTYVLHLGLPPSSSSWGCFSEMAICRCSSIAEHTMQKLSKHRKDAVLGVWYRTENVFWSCPAHARIPCLFLKFMPR